MSAYRSVWCIERSHKSKLEKLGDREISQYLIKFLRPNITNMGRNKYPSIFMRYLFLILVVAL